MLQFSDNSPVLVFGGPYSNLAATLALRSEAERLGIAADHVVCTGDVVAYCAEPAETTQAIKDWGCHVIQGNCEQQLSAGAADCACNFEEGSACDRLAKGWYPFADARMTPELRTWMGQLPETLCFSYAGRVFRVVHGGVTETARWVFASNQAMIADELATADADVVLAGHCGIPFIKRVNRGVWFNAGAIGMPANDGTPDVWFGLLTAVADGLELSTHRLSYDHQQAAGAMRRWGYANGYARALVTGLWPSLDVLPEVERAATGVRLRPRTLRLSTAARAATAAE